MLRSFILAALVGTATLFGTSTPAEAGRVRVWAGPNRIAVRTPVGRFVTRPVYRQPVYVRPRYVAPRYAYPAYGYPVYGYQSYGYPAYGYGGGVYVGGPRFGVGVY